jgi:peroxiredoxin Q/BCP
MNYTIQRRFFMNNIMQRGFVGIVCGLLLTGVLTSLAVAADDFTVKSATNDSTFQLSKHRGQVVVLHFLLKTECPFCLRYTHDYSVLAEKNPEVVHVFLKPDSEAEIKSWAEKLDKNDLKNLPQVYRDPDAKLAEEFKIPDGYKFHGQTVHYPALVALDGKGKELFRYVGKSNSDRMAVEDFRAKLKEATGKSSP